MATDLQRMLTHKTRERLRHTV